MPFQNVLYKIRSCMLILTQHPAPPQVEPCAEMANRRRSSDRLRGRELSPCVASTSDLHFHMLMVQRGGFGVNILSWDLCLKGSFYRGQPSRGRLIRNPLRMCIRDPLGPQGACSSKEKTSWRGVTVKAHHLIEPSGFISKNITKVL